ncbi:hypothetical protein QBC38DRAFT_462634, partial [Podospora fimiseda]
RVTSNRSVNTIAQNDDDNRFESVSDRDEFRTTEDVGGPDMTETSSTALPQRLLLRMALSSASQRLSYQAEQVLKHSAINSSRKLLRSEATGSLARAPSPINPPKQPSFTRIDEPHTVGKSEGTEDDADNERPKRHHRERPKTLAANRNFIRWLSHKLEVTHHETSMRLQATIDDVYEKLDEDVTDNKAHYEERGW